ncbi:MAG TPA: hypothetical protein VHS81_03205 [Caulobacteraceae bacterium]|jgi:hypothetical protein|nr:hypothetical protein [Caulobacteraceae bacterium]
MSMSQDDPRRPTGNDPAGDAVDKSATDASQGTKTGHIRWVLVFSLLLAVVVLGAAWLVYSSSHPHEQPPSTAQAALVSTPGAG